MLQDIACPYVYLPLWQVLAEQFCGAAEALTRIDCSELMQRHSGSKLIGAPPGEPPCWRQVTATDRLD
jgi:hypothetical protein